MPVRALALFVVVPLLLAGCSQDVPTPQFQDPTPSATPTASQAPERESARDFIRRWAEADRQMFATGDTTEFLALGPDCDDCRKIAATAEKIYQAGGVVKWAGWRILRITPHGPPSGHAFRFVVDSAPTRYRESAAGQWKTLKGGRGEQLIVLEPSRHSWHVLESKAFPR